jgi:uncharacterized protein YndB with AHSA1/START domain
MPESLKVSTVLPASPLQVFTAWLDSALHARMTGSGAEIDPKVGGAFTTWDGYIEGKTLALDSPHRILQAWRTSEFPQGAPDSRLEILLTLVEEGTQLTLVHTLIPDGQAEMYRTGWLDYYFTPMQAFFSQNTAV